jgi:peptide/nickel transport system permease protein
MIQYTLRRLALLVPQLLAVTVVTFLIVLFTPGNPARAQLGPFAPRQAVYQLEEQLGMHKPAPVRYGLYVWNVFHGDFGRSWVSGSTVRDDLTRRAPATFELITIGFLGALLVAIPLGVVTAVRGGGLVSRVMDRFSFVYGLMAGAIPDFWFALILVFLFFHTTGLAASPIGQLDLSIETPPKVTGLLLVDSLLAGNLEAFQNHLSHLALPVATLVFINAAPVLRMTRNSVLANLQSDFIRFARANGLPSREVIRYALRNALLPIITLAGVLYTILIAGAVLTETIFSWGGVGQYAVQSVLNADWVALQAVILLGAAVSLVIYLVLDLLHALVDPRIRY